MHGVQRSCNPGAKRANFRFFYLTLSAKTCYISIVRAMARKFKSFAVQEASQSRNTRKPKAKRSKKG